MQSAQERPDVGWRDEFSFDVADDFLQFAAVAHGRAGDEAFSGETLFELATATRGPRAIEEPGEVLEKRIRTAQRDKGEAVVILRKVRGVEVFPEIGDGLYALLVRRADGEAAFHLAGEMA